MKTQGEIEAAICQGIARFEQDYMGRGPKGIQTHLIDDLLVVRLQGVLTVAEQQRPADARPAGTGACYVEIDGVVPMTRERLRDRAA